MAYEKQQVLQWAPQSLNLQNQPWYVTVEGDSIVARWKWMDVQWFAPKEVTKELQAYTFTITLKGNGKYKELDTTVKKASTIQDMGGGKVKLGTSQQVFIGKKTEKAVAGGIGMNNTTGQVGVVGFKYSTDYIKQPVRAFMQNCGWQKA
ncbi:MAG: hypothetical protein FWE65_03370 [Eggerthellaceae bacterium]|nr:hypothetical protein [Eggerthellaceae bacterium]